MKLKRVSRCPKCMVDQPFILDQREVKPGETIEAECRQCGALVEVIHGNSSVIIKKAEDQQRKLFD